MTPSALRSHVVDQLMAVGGIMKGEEIQILCPFHNDHTPSLNVHIGHKLDAGTYHCFSCHARGAWNRLAHVLHLEKVVEVTTPTVSSEGNFTEDLEDPFNLLALELKDKEVLKEETYRKLKGTEAIPDNFSWRGFNGNFYSRLGSTYYWTDAVEYLHFPFTTNGEYKGYTLIAVKATGKFTKYQIFAEAKKVFFLYDMLPENQSIVLTEGHYDAMRLIGEGFFATAILGVNNWSSFKKDLLIAKNPSKIVIAFDGDVAGYEASVKIFRDLCDGLDVDIFYLPLQTPKLDPGNMSEEYLNLLRSKVYGELPTWDQIQRL